MCLQLLYLFKPLCMYVPSLETVNMPNKNCCCHLQTTCSEKCMGNINVFHWKRNSWNPCSVLVNKTNKMSVSLNILVCDSPKNTSCQYAVWFLVQQSVRIRCNHCWTWRGCHLQWFSCLMPLDRWSCNWATRGCCACPAIEDPKNFHVSSLWLQLSQWFAISTDLCQVLAHVLEAASGRHTREENQTQGAASPSQFRICYPFLNGSGCQEQTKLTLAIHLVSSWIISITIKEPLE